MWSQRSKDCEIHKVLQQQRSRLAIPWQCPEEGYGFMTEVKRAWAAHLLRTHHLLFRGRGKAPCPLEGQELQDRLEAFRCCNRVSKQRARENHRVMTQPRSWSIADSSPMWILGGRFGSRPRPWSGGRLGRGWCCPGTSSRRRLRAGHGFTGGSQQLAVGAWHPAACRYGWVTAEGHPNFRVCCKGLELERTVDPGHCLQGPGGVGNWRGIPASPPDGC